MPSIINHNPPADDGDAPLPAGARYLAFRQAVEAELARRGLKAEPWPLPPADGAA